MSYLLEMCIKRRDPGFARDSRERRTLQASVTAWDGGPLPKGKASFDDCVGMIEATGVRVEFAERIDVMVRRTTTRVDSQGNVVPRLAPGGKGDPMEAQGEIRVAPADLLDFEYQGNVREEGPDGLLVRWTLKVESGAARMLGT